VVVEIHAPGTLDGGDVIVFGRDGTAFHTYIAFDGIRVDRPEVAATGVWIRRTKDGLTWDPPVRIVDHVNTVMPFEDKPWTAVDRGAGSPHRGNVYVAWTRFDVYGSADPSHRSTIWFARSRDGGRSFQPPEPGPRQKGPQAGKIRTTYPEQDTYEFFNAC
jgi:hypothetical protein